MSCLPALNSLTSFAFCLPRASTGTNNADSTPMMAMTTSSSIRVNPADALVAFIGSLYPPDVAAASVGLRFIDGRLRNVSPTFGKQPQASSLPLLYRLEPNEFAICSAPLGAAGRGRACRRFHVESQRNARPVTRTDRAPAGPNARGR